MQPIRPVLLAAAVMLAGGPATGQEAPPRLAVVIAVDQMRADFLDRYDEVFTGGFRRLLDRGVVFTDAHQDHAATETAVGHATIGTGVYPRRHGIVGNNYYDRVEARAVYAMADSTAPLVGLPDGAASSASDGRSPRRLLRPTVVDWVKARSPGSRAFSVAIKDRSGTLMAGAHADGAYWYDLGSGNMITSTYYRSALPDWVRAFNDAGRFAAYQDSAWRRLLPEDAYGASRPDAFATEGNGRETTFPHALPAGRGFFTRVVTSGYADPIVLEFARTLIEAEGLGEGDEPDLLFIGASAGDYVGHAYGPWSQEAQDYYYRLDRALGAFLDYLDARFGADGYVVVLSADHGTLPLPEYLAGQGVDAERVTGRDAQETLRTAVELASADVPSEIRVSFVGGIVLSYDSTAVTPAQVTAFAEALAARLRDVPYVAGAFTQADLDSDLDAPMIEQYRKQAFPGRGPDIRLMMREHVLFGVGRTGTSHGSPYRYDTHVPLVFMGPGLRPARVDRRVRTVDLAPTLSVLLGADPPADLDGIVLVEATAR